MANIRWNDPSTGKKAQFVAETMKEALFDFSYDSNRVPSLNLHYFCQDFIMTYQFVDDGLMKEGNLIPLIEEFNHIINKSAWLPNGIDCNLLSFKNPKGYFEDISKAKNIPTEDYYNNAVYIDSFLESKSNYCKILLTKIKEIVDGNSFTYDDKNTLYYCVREYLTELINSGFSKGHLYNQTQNKLFSAITPSNDVEYLMTFLESLQPKSAEYDVVFGISVEIYNELKGILKGFRQATPKEQKLLKTNYVAENKFKSFDPVSALQIAKQSFSTILSVYNACMHVTEPMIYNNGRVKLVTQKKFRFINDSLNLLKKNPNKKRKDRKNWLNTAVTKQIPSKLLSSFELHNTALSISDPQTQLLTLWTINELLIDANQSNMNIVNYISNLLCSVLNDCYYRRKIQTLYQIVIRNNSIRKTIKRETRGNNEIEKFAYILKDNNALKSNIIAKLSKHPLNAFKIEMLSNVFANKESMENDLLRHSNRLRWQIMRIYRYRCLAVHDGNLTHQIPCMNGVLENLHYYVDELFNYIFAKREEGIYNLDAILSSARIKEASIFKMLKDKTNPISDDEFLDIIFK